MDAKLSMLIGGGKSLEVLKSLLLNPFSVIWYEGLNAVIKTATNRNNILIRAKNQRTHFPSEIASQLGT
jgi:hypothetical protein